MKPETIWLGSQSAKQRAIRRINELEINGSVSVKIADTKGKSARQRGLQWRWYTDVAACGIGGKHEDTKDGVHIVSKYRFGRPIIRRDMPEHWKFINALETEYAGNSDALMYIADKFISTEDFTVSQMAEYLTDFERYYVERGASLLAPDDGLLDWANEQNAA